MRPRRSASLPTLPRPPALGLWWLARWLLVLLLAWDQAASPLHQHHHDSGVDAHWSSAPHAQGAGPAPHIEDADDAAHLAHAVIAIRPRIDPSAQPVADAGTALIAQALAAVPALDEPPSRHALPWPDGRPPPFASPLCLPPAGRAPPLHA